MITSFAELAEKTRAKIADKGIPSMGVIFPRGGKCLEAIVQAVGGGYVKPVLFGPKAEIEKAALMQNVDVGGLDIFDTATINGALVKTIEAVSAGDIQFILKGSISSRDFVDMLLLPETGFVKKGQVLSHVGVIQAPKYRKLMFVTDAAVNSVSNADIKIAITRNAAVLAKKLGIQMPKAALLAAVESIYPAVPVTMEEAAIAKMSDRGQISDVIIDGPLSFDVAIDAEVAKSKGITNSRVAGDTDIFVNPSLETANGLYKAMVMYANGEAAGIIMGGPVPIASTFTVDPVKNIINSIILGAYIS
ncbi:MAG: phosphate acetyltransferase [candidate division Zixibacteria bacterium HGW-Zixibacteria-1]|nr:MAG: phosphate acetyltransferase [candidate division Zixibacteria bacterium HGW-Zixibacteria-1]